jgi:hypothetical protein
MDSNTIPAIDDKKEKEEALQLFREGVRDVLSLDHPDDGFVINQFNFTLIRFMLDDPIYRQNIERALYENKEELTQGSLLLGDKEQPPTVGNWLKDFIQREGSGLFDNVALSRYLTNSPNTRHISEEDRQKVRKLLRLYRNFKFFPESMGDRIVAQWEIIPMPAGEEVLAKATTVKTPGQQGEIENIEFTPSANPLDMLKAKYETYRLKREPVLKIEDELIVQTRGEVSKLSRELSLATRTGDKNKAIACLKLMARQGALLNSLHDNLSWLSAVSEYIQKKYTGKFPAPEVAMAVANLKMDAKNPAAISELLQYILKEKLKLNENDSALIGVEIGQLLGEAYQGLAYGNQATGSFEWSQNKIVDKKLVSEI